MARGQISVVHVVSAAEAAYANLYCHFSRFHEGGQFLAALPQVTEEWDIELKALYCELLRAGVPVHGVPIGMYYVRQQWHVASMSYGIQGWTRRIEWQGSLWLESGFGFHLRQGAVLTDDELTLSAVYEAVIHGRPI